MTKQVIFIDSISNKILLDSSDFNALDIGWERFKVKYNIQMTAEEDGVLRVYLLDRLEWTE